MANKTQMREVNKTKGYLTWTDTYDTKYVHIFGGDSKSFQNCSNKFMKKTD